MANDPRMPPIDPGHEMQPPADPNELIRRQLFSTRPVPRYEVLSQEQMRNADRGMEHDPSQMGALSYNYDRDQGGEFAGEMYHPDYFDPQAFNNERVYNQEIEPLEKLTALLLRRRAR